MMHQWHDNYIEVHEGCCAVVVFYVCVMCTASCVLTVAVFDMLTMMLCMLRVSIMHVDHHADHDFDF